jgi:hypothetical protein
MVSLTTWAAMKVASVIAAPAVTNSGSQMAAIGTLKNARPQAMTRMEDALRHLIYSPTRGGTFRQN